MQCYNTACDLIIHQLIHWEKSKADLTTKFIEHVQKLSLHFSMRAWVVTCDCRFVSDSTSLAISLSHLWRHNLINSGLFTALSPKLSRLSFVAHVYSQPGGRRQPHKEVNVCIYIWCIWLLWKSWCIDAMTTYPPPSCCCPTAVFIQMHKYTADGRSCSVSIIQSCPQTDSLLPLFHLHVIGCIFGLHF